MSALMGMLILLGVTVAFVAFMKSIERTGKSPREAGYAASAISLTIVGMTSAVYLGTLAVKLFL